MGGYEAEAEHQQEVEDAYRRLADLIGARPSELALVGSASRAFETWESNPALTLALGEAAAYAQNVGLEAIWQRVQELARYLRQRLSELPGATVHDRGQVLSGIVAFSLKGVPSLKVKEYLGEHKINVHTSTAQSALLDMQDWGVSEVVRASVHYFNTEEEIDTVVHTLAEAPFSNT